MIASLAVWLTSHLKTSDNARFTSMDFLRSRLDWNNIATFFENVKKGRTASSFENISSCFLNSKLHYSSALHLPQAKRSIIFWAVVKFLQCLCRLRRGMGLFANMTSSRSTHSVEQTAKLQLLEENNTFRTVEAKTQRTWEASERMSSSECISNRYCQTTI